MGYFSNGTEGMSFEQHFCSRCLHAPKESDPPDKLMCPVWEVHQHFNYEQHDAAQAKLKQAMNLLIEEKDNFVQECRMFVLDQHADQEPLPW